jgi:hypothetical protein
MIAPLPSRMPEAIELVVRPGAVLRRVARSESSWTLVAATFAAPLFAIAAFYAFSYAGAVTAGHLVSNLILHVLLFSAQAAVALAVGKISTGRRGRAVLHAFGLTYLPLEIFFLFLLGVFLAAPAPYDALFWLLRSYVLPAFFGIVVVWGIALVYIAFRELAGGRRLVAAGATALHYALLGGLVWLYVAAMDLLPLPWGA